MTSISKPVAVTSSSKPSIVDAVTSTSTTSISKPTATVTPTAEALPATSSTAGVSANASSIKPTIIANKLEKETNDNAKKNPVTSSFASIKPANANDENENKSNNDETNKNSALSQIIIAYNDKGQKIVDTTVAKYLETMNDREALTAKLNQLAAMTNRGVTNESATNPPPPSAPTASKTDETKLMSALTGRPTSLRCYRQDAVFRAEMDDFEAERAGIPPYHDEDSEEMPWEQEGWVPRTSTGKVKTPNVIRNALQKYINESDKTQTFIVKNELQVNNNTFRKFMNPKTYKNQWSATQNGTYWAAAKLLEKHAYEQKQAKKQAKAAAKKRKSTASNASESPSKKAKPTPKTTMKDMEAYMEKVQATTLPVGGDNIYDSCPQVIKKINDFLKRDGVSKAAFCRMLDKLNHNSLNRFLSSKKQAGAGMVAYERAYCFFEKMRLLENQPKSKARLSNEKTHPNGFSTKGVPTGRPPCMLFDPYLAELLRGRR